MGFSVIYYNLRCLRHIGQYKLVTLKTLIDCQNICKAVFCVSGETIIFFLNLYGTSRIRIPMSMCVFYYQIKALEALLKNI